MPNHDGTGPAKGCCNKEGKKESGCGCKNQHRNHGEDGSQCCHSGEKHRHHGAHSEHGGCCKGREK